MKNAKLKDQLVLLVVSIICAVVAWLFWNVTGQLGFVILASITYIYLIADNVRLRKKTNNITKTK